jgi:hypothetical protein
MESNHRQAAYETATLPLSYRDISKEVCYYAKRPFGLYKELKVVS